MMSKFLTFLEDIRGKRRVICTLYKQQQQILRRWLQRTISPLVRTRQS